MKWLKKLIAVFLSVLVILAVLVILIAYSPRYGDEFLPSEFKEKMASYMMTPDNAIEFCSVNFFKVKAKYYNIIGDNEQASKNWWKVVHIYEGWRYIYQMSGLNEDKMSEWFEKKVPVYKETILFNLNKEIEDNNRAFYYSELCRGRTLTDRSRNVLISKRQFIDYKELDKLSNYSREINNLALKIKNNEDISNSKAEYLRLQEEERLYTLQLHMKYNDIMISKDPQKANRKYGYESKDPELASSLEDFKRHQYVNFNPKKICHNIPDNACLVEFLKISDDSMIIFVVHNDASIKAVNIPTDKKFYENLQLYHDLNAYPDINALHRDGKYFWSMADGTYKITVGRNSPNSSATAVNDNAKWLELRQTLSVEISQKILQPVEQFIGNTAHWIISPDAELNIIPFETLTYHDKMLVESVNISYVPSLAVLNMMKHRERKNFYLGVSKDLFAMGNAVYGDNTEETSRGSQADFFNSLRGNNNDDFVDIKSLRWNNLPGTDKEVDKVAALFESKDIFKQNDASEKNLKEMNEKGELAQYKYLLFSTHGLFVPEKPEWSSIVLSQEVNDEDNDGYVTITEWMSYDLRSSLVYLSACETGLGDYQVGEGIMGIPYALTVAGNKDTVMSLWKVDDEATAEFTAAVFEKLQRGKSEVAALNDTKREFLKKNNSKYSSPSVWSAFVLYGI